MRNAFSGCTPDSPWMVEFLQSLRSFINPMPSHNDLAFKKLVCLIKHIGYHSGSSMYPHTTDKGCLLVFVFFFYCLLIWLPRVLVVARGTFVVSSPTGFSSYYMQAQMLRGMWDILIWDQTSVPCITRQILSRWTTREILKDSLLDQTLISLL